MKKHRRKRMKPYQVKLRVVGILSLIAALLVIVIPFPARALDGDPTTHWQEDFEYTYEGNENTPKEERFIDLQRYIGDSTLNPEAGNFEKTVLQEPGFIYIDSVARDGQQVEFKTRIGVNGSEVFRNREDLTKIYYRGLTAGSLARLFDGCTALTEAQILTVTPDVNNFDSIFRNCRSLEVLNLSGWNLSGLPTDDPKDNGMFEGCSSLQELLSPMNVPEAYSGKIALPGKFRYEYEENGGTVQAVTQYLPALGDAGITENKAFTLTRVNEAETLTIVPSETIVKKGTEFSLTVTVTPEYAVNGDGKMTVTLDNPDTAVLEFVPEGHVSVLADQTEARVTLTNGSAVVKLNAIGASARDIAGNALPLTLNASAPVSDVTGADTLSTTAEITVLETIIPVSNLALSPAEATVTIDSATSGTVIITPLITPEVASDKRVSWQLSDDTLAVLTENADGTVTVAPTGNGIGTVYVTAAAGSRSATATVHIVSPYTFSMQDLRTDASNRNANGAGAVTTKTPLSENWVLRIETDSTHQADIDALLEQKGNYNPRSYFTLSKYDAPLNEETGAGGTALPDTDFGTATVVMALPGDMLLYPARMPAIFALRGSTLEQLPEAEVQPSYIGDTGRLRAVRFAVDTADLAEAYVLVMDDDVTPTGYIFKTVDERGDKPESATATAPTNQTSDLYLFIEDTAAPVLKPLVEADTIFDRYTLRRYYDIYLTTNPRGDPNKEARVEDFGTMDIRLTVPSSMNISRGSFRMVAENKGAFVANPGYTLEKDEDTGIYSVCFTADHFSEYALLYAEADMVTITVSANDYARGSVYGGGAYAPGETVTIRAVANDDYVFTQWKDSFGNSRSNLEEYRFPATEDIHLIAEFSEKGNSGESNSGTSSGASNSGGSSGSEASSGASAAASASSGSSASDSGGGTTSSASATTSSGSGTTSAGGASSSATSGGGGNAGTSGTSSAPSNNSSSGSGASAASSAASSGASAAAGNASDMPTTGIGGMYRALIAIILVLSGTVEILLSVPARRRYAAGSA